MELKPFKKTVNDILVAKNFSKKGSYYYSFVKDLIIIVGLQKSNFSYGYYINIGYVIQQLNPTLKNPRDVDGDVCARFSLDIEGKRTDCFDLEKLNDENKLKDFLEENINEYIEPVTSLEKLKTLINKKPVMLYQTKISAKQLMGF